MLVLIRQITEQVAAFLFGARVLEAAKREPLDLGEPGLIFSDGKPKMSRDLFLFGRPLILLLKRCDGGFDELGAPALLPWRPSPTLGGYRESRLNLVLSVRFQFDIVCCVITVDSRDQPATTPVEIRSSKLTDPGSRS